MERADSLKVKRHDGMMDALRRAKTLKVANAKGSQEVLFSGELVKARPKAGAPPADQEAQKATTGEGAAEGGGAAGAGAAAAAAASAAAEGAAAGEAASGAEQSREAAGAGGAGGKAGDAKSEVEEAGGEKAEVKPAKPLQRAATAHKWGRIVDELLALEEEEEKKMKTGKQPGPARGSDVEGGSSSWVQERWGKLKEAVLSKALPGHVAG